MLLICESLLSTDVVVTGIVRQLVASAFRFGYIVLISSEVNSLSMMADFIFVLSKIWSVILGFI